MKQITVRGPGEKRDLKHSSFRYIVFLKEKPTERVYLNNPREVRRFTDKVGTEALDSIWRETDFLRRDGARSIFLVWSSYKLKNGREESER